MSFKRIELSTFIAITVTVVWATSFIADIFIPGYDPSPFIHLAMMTVVGAIFGKNFFMNQALGQGPPPPPPAPGQQQPPIIVEEGK